MTSGGVVDMKKALEQIKREDERMQQWRREWGELRNGPDYEHWIEGKLLQAEDEIAQWRRDYASNEKERSHLVNTVLQEERSLSNQRLARANRLLWAIEYALALTNTGSEQFRTAFDPDGVGEIPAGWRVVEKVRSCLLECVP